MKNQMSTLLILLVFLLILASCGVKAPPTEAKTNETAEQTSSQTETVSPETTSETEEGTFKPLEGLDLQGEEFRILVPKSGGWAQYFDFTPTGETEEPVNDANYLRLQQLLDLYNVKVVETVTSGEVSVDASNDIKGGLNTYDAIHIKITEAGPLAQAGSFVDLNTVESVNLENPWYNQNARGQLSIANKLFFILGDISVVDNDGIQAMCFNKGLVAENELESPYALIENDEWTLSNMYEMLRGYTKDLDGDGDTDLFDRWGYLAAHSSMIGQIVACGVDIVSKDGNDLPYLSLYNTRSAEIVDAIVELYADRSSTFHLDDFTPAMTPGGVSTYEYGNTMFMENRLLFRQTAMYRIIQCRQMEEDFGIIPYPKYDNEQEEYRHSFSFATPVIAIPSTADDSEINGAIIEALSYYGRKTVYPAYCERVLKGILSRDNESKFCLDIIFDTATYDLGLVLQLGEFTTMFGDYVQKGKSTFASDYDSRKSSVEKVIEQYIEGYGNII